MYIPVKGNDEFTHLKVDTYYSIGGMNYFVGESERRGIWLSVTPVQRTQTSERYTAFTGSKICLLELKRKSDKALDQVLKSDLWTSKKDLLIQVVLTKNNLQLCES